MRALCGGRVTPCKAIDLNRKEVAALYYVKCAWMGWYDSILGYAKACREWTGAIIPALFGPLIIEMIIVPSNASERTDRTVRPFCQAMRFHTAASGT